MYSVLQSVHLCEGFFFFFVSLSLFFFVLSLALWSYLLEKQKR